MAYDASLTATSKKSVESLLDYTWCHRPNRFLSVVGYDFDYDPSPYLCEEIDSAE